MNMTAVCMLLQSSVQIIESEENKLQNGAVGDSFGVWASGDEFFFVLFCFFTVFLYKTHFWKDCEVRVCL